MLQRPWVPGVHKKPSQVLFTKGLSSLALPLPAPAYKPAVALPAESGNEYLTPASMRRMPTRIHGEAFF